MALANVPKSEAPSLRDIRDQDPYRVYEIAREAGNVVWDEGMQAWLVLDYDGCAFVERHEDLFAEPTSRLPGAEVMTGPHEFRLLNGEPHRILHHFLSRRWAPTAIEPYREEFIRPVVSTRISRIRSLGHVELWADFASMVPIAIIARVIGLPSMEDDDLRRVKVWVDAVLSWRHTYGAVPSIVSAAIDATQALERLLLPLIRERREVATDDLASGLWNIGPSIASDWNERDVLDNLKPLFEAGAETTALLICTGSAIALGDHALHERIKAGGEPLTRFVDEVLRHTTPVHWRARVATQDVELGRVMIRAGDRVHPVNAAANRDPARYAHPHDIDIDRTGYLSHLAFNAGPRHCAGAWLARTEAYEAILGLLSLPAMRLDPAATPPRLAGHVLRTYRPLHVLFDN